MAFVGLMLPGVWLEADHPKRGYGYRAQGLRFIGFRGSGRSLGFSCWGFRASSSVQKIRAIVKCTI